MNIELKPDYTGYQHFKEAPIGSLTLSHGPNGTIEVKVQDSVLGPSHTAWVFVNFAELYNAIRALHK